MADAFTPITGAAFQAIAQTTDTTVTSVVEAVHEAFNGDLGGDGGPIVTGALSALLAFATRGPADDATVRAMFIEIIDDMLPRVRASAAGHALLRDIAGHA